MGSMPKSVYNMPKAPAVRHYQPDPVAWSAYRTAGAQGQSKW
jgi:hypothetical protein